MFRRPHYIIFSAVLLLGLVLISLPSRAGDRIKLALSGLFLPLFGLAGSIHSLTDQASNSLRSKRDLAEEIARLRRENEELRLDLAQSSQIRDENSRLRDALGWPRQVPWKKKLAQVNGRDPANWWRTIRINLGRRDGLVANLPVLTIDGFLIGRVSQVGLYESQVVLVGDPNCKVAAVVEGATNRTGTSRASPAPSDGVISSSKSGGLDSSVVSLTWVNSQNELKPGQRVLTSALSGIFPRGIVIGQIVSASSGGYGQYQEARVKLAADLAHLEEVWVIFP